MKAQLRLFIASAALAAAVLGSAAAGTANLRPQNVLAGASQAAPQPAAGGEVRPAPLTPREKVGLPVFLAGLWLTIAFLLYFLRLRVREADRVFRTGFYGKPEGHGGPPKL